jgi:hypothetical protein
LPVARTGAELARIVCLGRHGAGGHHSGNDPETQRFALTLRASGVRLSVRQGMVRLSFHLDNATARSTTSSKWRAAGTDASTDASTDTGADTGVDTGTDAGTDGGARCTQTPAPAANAAIACYPLRLPWGAKRPAAALALVCGAGARTFSPSR